MPPKVVTFSPNLLFTVYILIQLLGLTYGGRAIGMEKPNFMDKHALEI